MTEVLVSATTLGSLTDPVIVNAVTGSADTPVVVEEDVGIVIDPYAVRQTFFVVSSADDYDLTSDPQVTPGLYVGQTVTFIGTDDTDAFTFVDGNGLLLNGAPALMKEGSQIQFVWNGTVWAEQWRTDVGVVVVASDVTLLNRTIHFCDTSSARLVTLPDPSPSLYITLKDMTGTASTHTVTLVRPGMQEIETVAASYVLNTDLFAVTVVSDGTDYFLI